MEDASDSMLDGCMWDLGEGKHKQSIICRGQCWWCSTVSQVAQALAIATKKLRHHVTVPGLIHRQFRV